LYWCGYRDVQKTCSKQGASFGKMSDDEGTFNAERGRGGTNLQKEGGARAF